MRLLPALLFLITTVTLRAEVRKWTNTDGRVIEAEYVRSHDKNAILKLKDGREVPVDLAKLSAADQEFVKGQGPGVPAAKKAAGFSDVVLDKKAWVMRPQPDTFGITGVALTQQLETPHFLITAGPKIKPTVMEIYAETCERLRAQMVRDLPGLETKSANRRLAVWLTKDAGEHALLGQCLAQMGARGGDWSDTRITGIDFPKDFAESKSILPGSRGFDTTHEASSQRNLLWPMRIHFMAATILRDYGHSATRRETRNFGMFNLSYCYFLESEITGKVETKVRFTSSMSNVEGFKNPRGWAAAVKRILDTTPLKPNLRRFMSLDPGEAEPIDVGAGFGLMQFIFKDPTRRAAINALLESARKEQTPSSAEEFAKAMGAESPEAFDVQWIEFLKSDSFR